MSLVHTPEHFAETAETLLTLTARNLAGLVLPQEVIHDGYEGDPFIDVTKLLYEHPTTLAIHLSLTSETLPLSPEALIILAGSRHHLAIVQEGNLQNYHILDVNSATLNPNFTVTPL